VKQAVAFKKAPQNIFINLDRAGETTLGLD
jgi:hypothetical protein